MTFIIASMVLMVALVGAILIVTPFIMPPTECFTVTVPPSAKQDPRVKALYRGYLIVTALVTVIGMAVASLMLPQADDLTASVVITVAVLVPLVASFAYMLRARSRVRALKATEGWTAQESRSAAFVSDDSIPQPVSLAWELLHVVVVAAIAAFALLSYDRMPDQIPIHAGLDGAVDSYADKTLGVALYPVLIAAFMGMAFTFVHWGVLRSKKPIDPAAPATSALAYGQFARLQSIVMLVGGLMLSACMGATFLLSSIGAVSLGTAGTIITVASIAFAAAAIWASAKYGQAGGRTAAELRTSDEVARDDDRFWKLGFVYFNPDDPSVFVPKRFGMGWTINCGRPAAWAAVIGIVVLTIGFVVAVEAMLG
ncbi:MAG: DUF1648 domain-containing protein [Atopobiaceae bacterium]|nr:DUF1648 domain-containing protein [Atopobiaceae bacterium]